MPVSINIVDFLVRSLDNALNQVSWSIGDTSEDVLDYTFQLFRSESPSGPFDKLTEPFQDRFFFVDNAVYVGDRWRMLNYQLLVTHVPSGDTKTFGPVALEPTPDLIALELRRHIQLLFHEYAGRRCWVLPARTFGQRCSCWNATLKKRTRSRCVTCFDTGFVRGYLSPIEVWMQVDPSARAEQTSNVGAQQQSNTTGRLGYYPMLKPRDLIIEPENRRWRVVTVSATEHLRAPIHQEVQLHEIPPRDIEFEIPLKLDEALQDIYFEPARNYTMPMNLENFLKEEIPNIFSLYKTSIPNPGDFGQ